MYRQRLSSQSFSMLGAVLEWLVENMGPGTDDLDEMIATKLENPDAKMWNVSTSKITGWPMVRFSHPNDYLLFKLRWSGEFDLPDCYL